MPTTPCCSPEWLRFPWKRNTCPEAPERENLFLLLAYCFRDIKARRPPAVDAHRAYGSMSTVSPTSATIRFYKIALPDIQFRHDDIAVIRIHIRGGNTALRRRREAWVHRRTGYGRDT